MKRYAKRRLHTMRGDVRFELLFGNERYDRGFIHCGPIQRSEIAGV